MMIKIVLLWICLPSAHYELAFVRRIYIIFATQHNTEDNLSFKISCGLFVQIIGNNYNGIFQTY
jgi:hypothetical protein